MPESRRMIISEQADERGVRSISEKFELEQEGRVLPLLRASPSMISLLFDLHEAVTARFGPTRIVLRVVSNADGRGQLSAKVVLNLKPNEAVRQLEDFLHAWWLPHPKRWNERLPIGVRSAGDGNVQCGGLCNEKCTA